MIKVLKWAAPGLVAVLASSVFAAPPAVEVAQVVMQTLEDAGSIVTLEPPRVDRYWLTATRTAEGITLDGYVPDDESRDALAARMNTEASSLELAGGEPAGFAQAIEFGLAAVERLENGRFSLRSSVLTVAGTAATLADYEALLDLTETGVPENFVLVRNGIVPPPAEPFTWSATRDETGGVALTGHVPGPADRSSLIAAAVAETTDETIYASGAPQGFAADAEHALALLAMLEAGTAAYDGAAWSITGQARETGGAGAIVAQAEALGLSDWQIDVEAPPRPALPVASPYVWSASKTADGAITLAGHLPADPLRRVLMVRAGEATDTTQLAGGAPEGFGLDALAAMDALKLLAEGTVTHDGTQWTVEGTATPDTDDTAIRAALEAAATPPDQWQLALMQTEPEPLAPAADASDIAAEVEAEILTPAPEKVPAAEPQSPRALCEQHLAEFSARNAILFRSGSARISDDSRAALAELADFITSCPQAPIYIEGHTDADGEDRANLALSVSRAEAVADALTGLGVLPQRLYAVGYGESAPIAPNDTPQGKRLNRRIVVSLDGLE
jgi:OOP family OmpA-OmpF porin